MASSSELQKGQNMLAWGGSMRVTELQSDAVFSGVHGECQPISPALLES